MVGHTLYFYDKELSNSRPCQKTSLTQLYDFSEVSAATLICISSRATCPRFILLCQHKGGTQQKHNIQLLCWRDEQQQLLWAVKRKHPNTWLTAEQSLLGLHLHVDEPNLGGSATSFVAAELHILKGWSIAPVRKLNFTCARLQIEQYFHTCTQRTGYNSLTWEKKLLQRW